MRKYKGNDMTRRRRKRTRRTKNTANVVDYYITSHAHATCAVRETIAWQNATAASGHEFERQLRASEDGT